MTVYFLMMAGLILVFGKISDKGGIKKVLTFGFLVFVLGSFLCGISPSLGCCWQAGRYRVSARRC